MDCGHLITQILNQEIASYHHKNKISSWERWSICLKWQFCIVLFLFFTVININFVVFFPEVFCARHFAARLIGDKEHFWRFEWRHHETYSFPKLDQKQYFRLAVNLWEKMDLFDILGKETSLWGSCYHWTWIPLQQIRVRRDKTVFNLW
jgi:hypothetical protein